MVCEGCGNPIEVGSWPYCPHGRARTSVQQDTVEGGFWVENGFDRPTYFDSKKAHRDALAARGMEIRAKWAGPADKHLTRWDTVDLDAARTLLERGAQARRERNHRLPVADPEFPITVNTITFEKPEA